MQSYAKNILSPLTLLILAISSVGLSSPGLAIEVPGSADVGRIKPQIDLPAPSVSIPEVAPHKLALGAMPKQAHEVHLILKGVTINGVTAFNPDVFKPYYVDMLGKDITLDKVWAIAAQITDHYHTQGYFLSRAFVPAQTIDKGAITIQVVEGYVGILDMPENMRNVSLIRGIVKKVTDERPLTLQTVESVLLRLNDLPGVALRSVLLPAEGMEGAAKLTLVPQEKAPDISIQANDYGTRYAGPVQTAASFRGALIPMQETTLYGLASIPISQLHYGSIQQRIPLSFSSDIIIQANRGISAPAYKLKPYEIRGDSVDASIGYTYTILRQRQDNLSVRSVLDWRNASTDLLDAPLARDRIRVLRIGGHYDHADTWSGVNSYDVTISHGLRTLGASGENAPNPSRAHAKPNFTKEELTFSRLQDLGQDVNMYFSAMAQHASGALYSSEEVGYGGQAYGRAFDPSEITGIDGAMASLELRYDGMSEKAGIHGQPYLFYDIGRVWNHTVNQPGSVSAASGGVGLRLSSTKNISADFAIAKPLTRNADAPLFGDGESVRYLANLSYKF
jgi:hemolysin activation/secretion protein